MTHLQFLLYLLLLGPGAAGITVTAILWSRLREKPLLVILTIISAFTIGLLLFVVLFYVEAIAGIEVEAEAFVAGLNLLITGVTYGGIATLVRLMAPKSPRWAPFLLALPVVAGYVAFGILPPFFHRLGFFVSTHEGVVRLSSVAAGALFLGYGGWQLTRGGPDHPHPTIRFLVGSLGWMLVVFALTSITATAVVFLLEVHVVPTAFLNFVLYVAWCVTAILGFVRYLTHPVDVFGENGVPTEALRRYGISDRETEVIRHLSRGLSNREIAERLGVSFTTVRTHVYNIFKKTGAASRVELLRILSSG